MNKAQKLEYPESLHQVDFRTDPSIVQSRDVMSYGRQVRSPASKPARIVSSEEVNNTRRELNKF